MCDASFARLPAPPSADRESGFVGTRGDSAAQALRLVTGLGPDRPGATATVRGTPGLFGGLLPPRVVAIGRSDGLPAGRP